MSKLSKLIGGSKPTIPGYDTAKLKGIVEGGYNTRKNLLEGAFGQLPQFGQEYEKKANMFGDQFQTSNLGAAEEYQKGLAGIGEEEKTANELAASSNRERNFRNVPETERRIRDIVGATIGFGSGAAAPQLAAPTLQAAQQAGDFENQLEVDRLNKSSARREAGLGTVFTAKQQNALTKMGIDQDTAKMLLETGRGDVLTRAMELGGLEGEKTQSFLDIEQLAQGQAIAKAQADAAARSGKLGAITNLIGTGVGAFFGPTGAMIGNQVGNAVGGGGGGASGDALLQAILARRSRPNVAQTSTLGPVSYR